MCIARITNDCSYRKSNLRHECRTHGNPPPDQIPFIPEHPPRPRPHARWYKFQRTHPSFSFFLYSLRGVRQALIYLPRTAPRSYHTYDESFLSVNSVRETGHLSSHPRSPVPYTSREENGILGSWQSSPAKATLWALGSGGTGARTYLYRRSDFVEMLGMQTWCKSSLIKRVPSEG